MLKRTGLTGSGKTQFDPFGGRDHEVLEEAGHPRRMDKQSSQQSRSARRGESYARSYVEALSRLRRPCEARTPLVECLRILPKLICATMMALGMSLLPVLTWADGSAKDFTNKALQQCTRGRVAKDRNTRLAHFQQGQAFGEQAVALDERSAEAHFSLFCNLGELLRVDGESLTSLFGLRRMMKELDRALELNPEYLEAISAKGTLLVKLPDLLGGDVEKGEALLQEVLSRAPNAVNARLALAKVRCEHGRHQDAVTLASDALAIAQQDNQADFIPEARAVLEQLQANAAKSNHKAQF